jgi:hypothetical protein
VLQWYDGTSWEHRAYWGENLIAWGVDGTASLYPAGALPATGGWARLEVPAAAVGLEGATVTGMAFSLYDGSATWDRAGKTGQDAVLGGIEVSPTEAIVSPGQSRQFSASGRDQFGNPFGGPFAVTWSVDGGGSIDAAGLFTADLGADGTFTVTASSGAIAGTASVEVNDDTVWVEDAVPAGSTLGGIWTWVSTSPEPISGALAHQSTLAAGVHQHFFYGTSDPLIVNLGDALFTHVYLDPANTPRELVLQWFDGASWEHRAYWGENLIAWGVDGTASLYPAGALPATGGWVRLEVPASAVGLEGATVTGMAFSLYDGRATWDRAGKH